MEISCCDGASVSHRLAFPCGTSTIAELCGNKPHRTPHQKFKFRRPQLDTLTTQAPTIDLSRWGPTGFVSVPREWPQIQVGKRLGSGLGTTRSRGPRETILQPLRSSRVSLMRLGRVICSWGWAVPLTIIFFYLSRLSFAREHAQSIIR